MKSSLTLALGIVLATAGCGGGGGASGQRANATQPPAVAQPPAAASPAAPNNAPAMGGGSNDAVTNLPVFPGAAKMPMRINGGTFCNHKMSLAVYRANSASADQVADWYAGRMNGAIKLNIGKQMGGGAAVTGYTLVDPSGADAASVSQTHFGPSMGKMAQTMGANRTTIGLVTYNPPLSPAEMQMMRDITGGDAAARQRARAQLKAKCGGSGFSIEK